MGNKYTVYAHVTPNMKMYVGITSRKVEQRWRNGKGYQYNVYFSRAIKSYGWDNIAHIIIATGLTKSKAFSLEIETIKKYNTTDPNQGYNISKGGEFGSCGRVASAETRKKLSVAATGKVASTKTRHKMSVAALGRTVSEETRKKISLANLGKTMSVESRHKMSVSKTGENHSNYGKHASEETRKKLSLAHLGKTMSAESIKKSSEGRMKPILQYTLDGIFIKEWPSLKEAGETLTINTSNISRCAQGKLKTAGKYVWEFKTH